MKEILELLRRTMGLEASTVGTVTVERAVEARRAASHSPTLEDYHALLLAQSAELDELIEQIVVPESWFFRDGLPFVALQKWVTAEWLPRHPGASLRILTVPCSTGEEPYSVVMALLDAGVPPERFSVDAVDISRHAIARARRAVYGANSFRGRGYDQRDRYFQPEGEEFALRPEVRHQVRFEVANLLGPGFPPSARRYDVIFCRNLLIYFDRETQKKVVGLLAQILAADGLFFAGHAEMGALAGGPFAPAEYARSFAFRKLTAPRTTVRVGSPIKTTRLGAPPGTLRPPRPMTVRVSAALPTAPPPSVRLDKQELDEARHLADAGRLQDAARTCEAFLRHHQTDPQGWYLLGAIQDALGERTRAGECYAKVLYLQPDHWEALLQRALLAEQGGDHATAARLRERLGRLQEKGGRP